MKAKTKTTTTEIELTLSRDEFFTLANICKAARIYLTDPHPGSFTKEQRLEMQLQAVDFLHTAEEFNE